MTHSLHTYYADTIGETLDLIGLKITRAQLDIVTEAVLVSRDNESMATGHDCISNPANAEIAALESRLKQERVDADKRDREWAGVVGRLTRLDGTKIGLDRGEATYSDGRTHVIA